MPLSSHNQTGVGSKACGASVILCAAAELGTYDGPINDLEANKIYAQIWKGPNDESLISKVAGVLARFKLTSTIIEDRTKTGRMGALRNPSSPLSSVFEPAYQDYKADVKNKVPRDRRPGPAPFVDADFDDYARIMLVVALPKGETHWVLARRWNNAIHVMNPDGGTNGPVAGLLTWMNGPVTATKRIGNVDYGFTGVVLRVTRTGRGRRR
jgi:hypothetical protein